MRHTVRRAVGVAALALAFVAAGASCGGPSGDDGSPSAEAGGLEVVPLCSHLRYLVPPVGENLFIAAYRFDRPIGELARAVMPMVGVLLAGVLAITYIPALSLWLVRLLG